MATIYRFPDRPAETWRDLADQLTPGQIAELEYCEREQIPPGMPDPQQGHLNCARALARHNLAQAMCADIPAPGEARRVYAWEEWGERHGRLFEVAAARHSEKQTAGGWAWTVDVLGVQFDDGQIERHVTASVDEEPMTADEVRHLAAALLDAADELDSLQ